MTVHVTRKNTPSNQFILTIRVWQQDFPSIPCQTQCFAISQATISMNERFNEGTIILFSERYDTRNHSNSLSFIDTFFPWLRKFYRLRH